MDNTIVNTPQIPVSGLVAPGAILSVNGTIIEVDGTGTFTTAVLLDEGPNLVEVMATNLAGDEEYQGLAVIYIP
jgi:hypothetical protein